MRGNNLLQLIHQVTIELRFGKSLAQERFKSNLELRYQSKKDSMDQKSIKSSATPVPRYQMGKLHNHNKYHKQEQRGQPFPFS